MPVLECRCGMMMSIANAAPRKTCIRCGSAGLQPVEQPALTRSLLRRASTYRMPIVTDVLVPLFASKVVVLEPVTS